MSHSISLLGRTALITGATRGIGRAIADIFITAGAHVILTGTHVYEIKSLEAKEEDRKVKWLPADFSTQEGIDNFIDRLTPLAPIDICINNAGINIIKPHEEYSEVEYQQLMNINLTAPFRIAQALVPTMKECGFGRIVNIASIWSGISKPGRSLYSTSKAGIAGFTRALAAEYSMANILINTISPGFTLTKMTKQSLTNEEVEKLSNEVPVGRFASPAEIAWPVLFLCSEQNTYITGQNIFVDGGFTIV